MHWPYRPVVRFGRGGQCRARSKGASEGRKDERIVLWSCCILSAVNPESGARNLAVRLPRGIAHSQATAATTIVRVGLESPPSRSLRSHHENRPSRSLGLGHSLEAENRPCRSPKSGLDDCPDCHSEFAIRVGHAEVAMRLGDRLILIFCAPFAGLPPATSAKFFATRRVCPTRSMQRPGRRESFRLLTSSANTSFASKRPWPATGPKCCSTRLCRPTCLRLLAGTASPTRSRRSRPSPPTSPRTTRSVQCGVHGSSNSRTRPAPCASGSRSTTTGAPCRPFPTNSRPTSARGSTGPPGWGAEPQPARLLRTGACAGSRLCRGLPHPPVPPTLFDFGRGQAGAGPGARPSRLPTQVFGRDAFGPLLFLHFYQQPAFFTFINSLVVVVTALIRGPASGHESATPPLTCPAPVSMAQHPPG